MEIKAIKLISLEPEYFNLLSFPSAELITDTTMEVKLKPSGKDRILLTVDVQINSAGLRRTAAAIISMKYQLTMGGNKILPSNREDYLQFSEIILMSYCHARTEFNNLCMGTEFENTFLPIVRLKDIDGLVTDKLIQVKK